MARSCLATSSAVWPGVLAALLAWCGAATSGTAETGAELRRALATRSAEADTAVIVRLRAPLDLRARAVGRRDPRDQQLPVALRERLGQSVVALQPWLTRADVHDVRPLWIINGVALTLPARAVAELAARPGVARVDLDSHVQGAPQQRTPPARRGAAPAMAPPPTPTPTPTSGQEPGTFVPEWNIAAVRAPALWSRGQTGRGVVVALMDTGADLQHPQLRARWRAGANSWFDPHGEESSPYDALGHGTQSLAIILGGAGLGMAPDARWIAVRLFDSQGRARMSDIHRAFQWLLDPDGDPATPDAPDVVNASWTLSGAAAGSCIREFEEDILALRSAGMAVVFAAGNDGPAPGTSSSPGNNPGALSVGAVTRTRNLARQTSRGPSACDGSGFPRLLAPGVNVRTADLSHGGVPSYTSVSGSSLAAPHVSGALALLAAAFPQASVSELEEALQAGAAPGPDPQLPARLLDVQAAFEHLRAQRPAARPDGAPPDADRRQLVSAQGPP